MSATGQVPKRGNRHTIATKQQAIRYKEAGWTDEWIADQLGVAKTTVGNWVKPHREQANRETQARVHVQRATIRGAKPMGHYLARAEYKLARMRALHEQAGMTCGAIARVMRFDFGDPLTDDQVRYALAVGRYPRFNGTRVRKQAA